MRENKPIVIVAHNKELESLKQEMITILDRCAERAVFINKQRDNVLEEANAAKKEFWEKAEQLLLKEKLIEKVVPMKLIDGVIYESGDTPEMNPFIKAFFIGPDTPQ